MKRYIKTAAQIIFFIILARLMNGLVGYLQIPVPGSILGMIFVFVVLQTKLIRLDWVDFGAKWLIAEMLLFFIPSAVGIVQYKSMMFDNGLRIILVIVSSSVLVMIFAGLIAQKLAKPREGRAG
jgi:holin-like protein